MMHYRHDSRIGEEGRHLNDTAGVYRSDKFVVVERHNHRFPPRCIWCNAALDAGAAAPASPGTRTAVQPPVCPSCAATRNRLPRVVAIFGAVALLAAPVLYFTLGTMVAGVLLLTGLVDLFIAWRLWIAARSFHGVREDEQYIWIAGASAGFIAVLPPWQGMKLNELRLRDR
jgi:hypothetical protein